MLIEEIIFKFNNKIEISDYDKEFIHEINELAKLIKCK
jgi:hypothetical protein